MVRKDDAAGQRANEREGRHGDGASVLANEGTLGGEFGAVAFDGFLELIHQGGRRDAGRRRLEREGARETGHGSLKREGAVPSGVFASPTAFTQRL